MDNISNDFVFGTLATDTRRLAYLKAETGGVSHRHRLDPPDPLPGQPVRLLVTLGPEVQADHVTCYYTIDKTEPVGQRGTPAPGTHSVAFTHVGSVWDTLLWGYGEEWQATLPPQPHGVTVRYRIEAWSSLSETTIWASEIIDSTSGDGAVVGDTSPGDRSLRELGADVGLNFVRRARTFAYHVDQEQAPPWLQDAIIYQVFVDRFNPGGGQPFAQTGDLTDFSGGTLRGVTEKLDYIAGLGATVIWLSPVFPSPSHHGYDATDYRRIEPRLGDHADVRALLDAAHARGMRVLFDYCANHVSAEHPAFQDAIRNPSSPYRDWFTFTRYPDEYLCFFGVKSLPQVATDLPAARQAMIDYAIYWIEQGVDGFRLDYSIGPSHAFWTDFRAATRAVRVDSALFGEAVDTADALRSYAGRMDGCLDFLLLQALREFFAFASITASQFDTFLRRHFAYFPPGFVLPSFLDNHDMNRFLWVVQGDTRRLKLAALCQYTLPHPPILYYGTEAGLSQFHDVRAADGSGHPEEARLPMRWGHDQDEELLAFYRELGMFRRSTAALWRGLRQSVYCDDAGGRYAYTCADDRHTMLIALNNHPAPQPIPLPADGWEIVLASAPASISKQQVELAAYGGAILTLKR
jgi:glycosidase